MRLSDTKHTHRHIHTQVGFFEVLFSQMSKILNYRNASCYNVANSASFFFFFLFYQHILLLPTFIMPKGPFPLLAASKCLDFCFQLKSVASAIALFPRQHLLWRNHGQCSLTEPHQARSHAHVCTSVGNTVGGHLALPLCFCPTDLSSYADR